MTKTVMLMLLFILGQECGSFSVHVDASQHGNGLSNYPLKSSTSVFTPNLGQSLQRRLEQLEFQNAQLQALVGNLSQDQWRGGISFTVTGLANPDIPDLNHPLVFTNVLLNKGRCYDNTTGHFRAPVSGVYMFAVSMTVKAQQSVYIGVDLMVAGDRAAFAFGQTGREGSYSSLSLQAALPLAAGQVVWVQPTYTGQSFATAFDVNVFTGHLLYRTRGMN